MAVLAQAPLTIDEFSRLPRDGARHELDAGKLITMPPPKSLHSLVVSAVLEILQTYLRQRGFGRAMAEAGFVLSRNPLTIRQPDVCVLSKERIQSTGADEYFEGAPELAVEVISPSDLAEDMAIKVSQYLGAGCKQVWVLYPKSKSVHVFHSGGSMATFDKMQTLVGGDLLPQFSTKVSDLFLNENHANA